MKKNQLFVILFFSISVYAQQQTAFGVGEWFKFRIHYGFVNAGYATLEVKEATINSEKLFHLIGKGYTTGLSRLFF